MGCKAKHFNEENLGFFGKIIQKTGLTPEGAMARSPTIKNILGTNSRLLNENLEAIVIWSKKVNLLKSQFIKSGNYKGGENSFLNAMKKYSKESNANITRESMGVDGIFTMVKAKTQNSIFEEAFGGMSDIEKKDIKTLIDDLYSIYPEDDANYLLHAYTKDKQGKSTDGLSLIVENSLGSLESSILLSLKEAGIPANKIKYSEIKTFLTDKIKSEVGDLISDTALKNLVGDLLGEGVDSIIFKSKLAKLLIMETRAVVQTLKFSLNPGSNLMFGVNAFIMGNFNYMSKIRGYEVLHQHKLMDTLIDDFNILKSESRYTSTDAKLLDGAGEAYTYKMMDFVFGKTADKIVGGKLSGAIKTIAKGGSQTAVDIGLEKRVKKLSLTRALGKLGVNSKNADDFLLTVTKGIKDGVLDKKILIEIEAEALLEYNRFFTNSNLLALSRNRFTGWIPFSFLQHYVTARAAEVFDGFRLLARDIQSGEFARHGGFANYLNKNTELKTFMYSVLNSVTYGYYTNVMLGEGKGKDDSEKIKIYALNVNDQISSLRASLPYRMISQGLFGYQDKYADYKESRGEDLGVMDRGKIAIFGIASEAIRSMFREIKITDMLIGTVGLYNQGFNAEAISQNTNSLFNKAVNGMGRFGNLEGYEKYGLESVGEYDDALGYFLMGIDETNESVGKYNKLRTVEGVHDAIKNGIISKTWSTLMYSNPVKLVTGTIDMAKGQTYMSSEAKYNFYKEQIGKDVILNDLYNGNFNMGVLREDGIYDEKKIKNIFEDLVRYDYANKNAKAKDKVYNNIWGTLNAGKEEIFVEQVLKKISQEDFLDTINNGTVDIQARGFKKMILMAEMEVKGSSRIILSYLSNKMYGNLKVDKNREVTKKSFKNYSDKNLPQDWINGAKASVIAKMFPTMAVIDKESWFRLIETRLNDKHPEVFKIDNNKQKYFNSLALTDFVAYSEGKKADPDTRLLKNIFSVVGKFIKDPATRIDIANHTMKTIESLDVNPDVTNMMKVGVLTGNMDFVNSLMKDDEFYGANKTSIDTFLDIMFSTNKKMNNQGSKLIINDLDNKGKSQYSTNGGYTNYGKSNSSGYPSNKSNEKIYDEFQRKIPTAYQTPSGYTYNPQAGSAGHLALKGYPNIAKSYFKIAGQLRSAKTDHLVKGYVRKYPNDFYGQLKFRDQERVKIKRVKKKSTFLF